MRTILSGATAAITVAALLCTTTAQAASLTLLFNNDGESQLLERRVDYDPTAATDFGPAAGASRFITALNAERAAAQGAGRDVLTVAGGDNFLAGVIFNDFLDGNPSLDARVLNRAQYDAVLIGNHEFDFGPQVLANFVAQTNQTGPFISANLNFSGESSLQALVNQGRIAPSVIVTRGGERYGIVGATTEDTPFISSVGNVVVNPIVPAVQAEIDRLQNVEGVNKIIVVGQLQNAAQDVATIAQLRGVDIFVSGGYNPLLTDGTPPFAGNRDVFGQAKFGPFVATRFNGTNFSGGNNIVDADGKIVPIVSTAGDYEYLGRLDAEFDAAGNVTQIGAGGSRAILLDRNVAEDSFIEANVIAPADALIATLRANVIGATEVVLSGRRADVRSRETDFGNVIADALVFAAKQADQVNPDFVQNRFVVGLQNGGGIRNDVFIDPAVNGGQITEFDTYNALAFANFVATFNDVTPQQLKAIIEYSLGGPAGDGRFGQFAGVSFIYDPARPVGDRVLYIELGEDGIGGSGPVIYRNGAFGTTLVTLASIDFTLNGGDNYPFRALGLVNPQEATITYQQALFSFLTDPNGLNGLVTAARYGNATPTRIIPGTIAQVPVPAPAALALFGIGVVGVFAARRRRAA